MQEGERALRFCLLNRTIFLKLELISFIFYGSTKKEIDHHSLADELNLMDRLTFLTAVSKRAERAQKTESPMSDTHEKAAVF